jgi:hypothetical protein
MPQKPIRATITRTPGGSWEANYDGTSGYFITEAAAIAWLADMQGVLPCLIKPDYEVDLDAAAPAESEVVK